MTRQIRLIAILILLSATSAYAQTPIFWLGGSGTLTDTNWSDGTNSPIAPQPSNFLNIGNGGIVTFNSTAGFQRLRVGHNQAPGGSGAGTLTVSGAGNVLEATMGMAVPNAGIWIGNNNDGLVNLEDGAELASSRLVVVGAGDHATATGTLNIRTGGYLNVKDGNLSIADRSAGTEPGVAGVLNISGATSKIDIKGPGADLAVGSRARTGTYNQTDGIVNVNDAIDVGAQTSSSVGTTFSVSGGTITTGTSNGANAGNFAVGRGASVDTTVNISGTAVVNVGNRYLMGGSDGAATPTFIALGVVTHHSGGTLNTDRDIRIADAFISGTSDATYNLSGTGILNTNISAFTVAADSTSVIGRQGTGKFIQTGGTANFNSPLVIGSRETATTTTANGLYKVSAGDLNINAPTPTWPLALNIAPNGTGEFRVVGDDATIDVTGDFNISTTANGAGKLAFELETGDLLSQINVVGAATFGANSILAFDTTNASPTQTTYNLLTATSIVNSGLTFSGPAGWNFQIVSGGNGQILQLTQSGPVGVQGDYNNNGVVDAADYVIWRNGGPLQNEVNGVTPGTVTSEDYDAWRARFGNNSGSGTGTAVPEPMSALLCAIFAGCVLVTRHRNS